MIKVIQIGNREVKLQSNAATYIKYRRMFNEDLFKALQDMSKEVGGNGNIPDGAVAILLQAAFVMARQADGNITDDFELWLEQFELMDSIVGIQGVFEMLTGDQVTIDEAKKKKDLLNEK